MEIYQNEVLKICSQYKDFKIINFKQVCLEVNSDSEKFKPNENCIYLQKNTLGKSTKYFPVWSRYFIRNQHQSYIQINLKPEIINSDYIRIFLISNLGILLLSECYKSDLSKNKIFDLEHFLSSDFPIPEIKQQDLLVKTSVKISKTIEDIIHFKDELSFFPKNSSLILEKIEGIQSVLKQMTEEDKILSLIRKGENKEIEFKQSFFKNVKTGSKDYEIIKSTLKNIVGFLNSVGGILLIGVKDDGGIYGIEDDLFKSDDDYLLRIKNEIKSKIGEDFYSFINYGIFIVDKLKILKIECKPSNEPCFLEDKEFYVRTNPATDRLEGKKQVSYIKERFNSNNII